MTHRATHPNRLRQLQKDPHNFITVQLALMHLLSFEKTNKYYERVTTEICAQLSVTFDIFSTVTPKLSDFAYLRTWPFQTKIYLLERPFSPRLSPVKTCWITKKWILIPVTRSAIWNQLKCPNWTQSYLFLCCVARTNVSLICEKCFVVARRFFSVVSAI